jgi:hypothetical protein
MLANRERYFLDGLRGNREPTAANAVRIAAIAAAIRNDPRCEPDAARSEPNRW